MKFGKLEKGSDKINVQIPFCRKSFEKPFPDFIPFVVPFHPISVEQTSAFQPALAAARRQCDVIDVKNFTSNVRLLAEPRLQTALGSARFQCDVIDVKNFTSRNSGIGAFEGRRESVYAVSFL